MTNILIIVNIIMCLSYIFMLNKALNQIKSDAKKSLGEADEWREESVRWRNEIKDIVSSKK